MIKALTDYGGGLHQFGKKRGRKEDLGRERLRLTASAAFHDYRIIAEYDR